ncbi:MAG: hypothetical protein RM021_011870 [Nostoc sp. EkiNYC01]|nr:hypothetical protein [Nostoc sp. EkiNYC01]
MAKVKSIGKVRKYSPSKHPRGAKGRFVETPDAPKATTGRRSGAAKDKQVDPTSQPKGLRFRRKSRKPLTQTEVIKQSRTLKDIKRSAEVYRARLEFYQGLNQEQRRRLQEVLRLRKEKPKSTEIAKVSSETPSRPKKTNKPQVIQEPSDNTRTHFTTKTDKAVLKKFARDGELSQLTPQELKLIASLRSPTPRKPGDPTDIHIGDSGKINIWQGEKAKYGQPDPTFKVRTDKNHQYVVNKDGVDLVLNRHPKVITYKGETVQGVPSLHPKLAEMSDKALMRALIDTKGFVESSEAPPAPQWKQLYHGSVPKQYVAERGYGGMEIHHIDQWAKRRFDEITNDHDNGLITLDEAKDQMRSLLRPNPKEKSGYEIDIKDQDHRKFVVLAAGTHNFTSPLYFQNHPIGLHPDTGLPVQFGIPKEGAGGRNEFNTWRDGFWREVYKKETFSLLGELNRRVAKGKLSRDDARTLLKEAHEKATKDLNGMLDYKNKIAARNEEIRAAKEAAGLTKKKATTTLAS